MVPKKENPTQEEVKMVQHFHYFILKKFKKLPQIKVSEYHGRYVAALQTLYEEYNPKYGDPKVNLVIE